MKFKNLRTMLLVGTMAFSLALTGCGSTDVSEDTNITEETEAEAEGTEDENTTDGAEDAMADEAGESTEAADAEAEADAESETDENSIPAWVQSLYDAVISEDLDAVFETIETDDFAGSLTVDDEQDGYFESYDTYTMDDTYTLFLYAFSSDSYGTDVFVAVIPSEYINGGETLDDYLTLLGDDCTDYYITSSLSVYDGETTLYRSATIFDTWYDNYGLEGEAVYDLSEYK